MEQNKSSDERLKEPVVAGSGAEQNLSAVLESESVAQNEEKNRNGEAMHSSSARPRCAVEPGENWDEDAQLSTSVEPEENWDDDAQPSAYVIPTWALKSEEIYIGDVVQPSADDNFLLDEAFANDDNTSSVVSEDSFDFSVVEERNRGQNNYSFKYDMKKIFVRNINFTVSFMWLIIL